MSMLRPVSSVGNPIPFVIVGVVPLVPVADLADEPRPTWDADVFVPSEADEAAYLEMVALDADVENDHDAIMAETFARMHDETLAESFDPWDLVSPDELIECRGHHPFLSYDV